MEWFVDKYGKDIYPKMSINIYDKLYTKFGTDIANETLADIQDEKMSEET